MQFITEALNNYVVQHSEDEPALLADLTRETYQKGDRWPKKASEAITKMMVSSARSAPGKFLKTRTKPVVFEGKSGARSAPGNFPILDPGAHPETRTSK